MPQGDKISIKTCANPACAKTYTAIRGNQRFCSFECYCVVTRHGKNVIKKERTCIWCHGKYFSRQTFRGVASQKYCKYECGKEYRHMREAIEKQYFFETAKRREQFERLEQLGINYKLEGE